MKEKTKSKKYIPSFFIFTAVFTILSYILLLICRGSASVSDFLNRYVLQYVRLALASITSFLPFSLFEILLILLLPLLVAFIVATVKYTESTRGRVRSVLSLISVICLIFTAHIYTLGISYNTTDLAKKLDIPSNIEINKKALYDTAALVSDKVNDLADKVDFSDGETHLPYSFRELSEHITEAYNTLEEEYPIFDNFASYAKPVMNSSIMSDMGITGIYSYFTGEANINMSYPDYNLPFVVAHEFAHQRGFARENEANFIAYLVCISSDEPYVQYSGYLSMYEYLSSALYRTDKELYTAVLSELNSVARADMAASVAVTRAHRDSFLYKTMDKVNDAYLKANGTEGVISYSYVVRLAVAYYREK